MIVAVVPIVIFPYTSRHKMTIKTNQFRFVLLIIGNNRMRTDALDFFMNGLIVVTDVHCGITDLERSQPLVNALEQRNSSLSIIQIA